MKERNIIREKTFKFGLRILKLYTYLRENNLATGLCSQILRCGTSIGANVEEAIGGSSRKDFIYRLEIAYRETRETNYWLRLLQEGEIIETRLASSLLSDCEEIQKILAAIIHSAKTEKITNS